MDGLQWYCGNSLKDTIGFCKDYMMFYIDMINMYKKPRIAFCFSGQARTLDQTYQLFQKNLFNAAKEQGFDYDVFCAVEDDEDVDKVNLLHPTKIEKIKSSDVREIINEKLGFFIKNQYSQIYGYAGKNEIPNLLQQLYKICRSINLKNVFKFENNVTYDIVFKLRFDTPFPRRLNFNEIYKTIKESDKIVLCNRNRMIPSYKFLIKIEDFYFIMNDKTSNILGDIFEGRKISLKGFEIKYKKLNKSFEKIDLIYSKLARKMLIFSIILGIPFSYLYAIFFQPISAETLFLNYFKNSGCEVNTNQYITIWFVKDKKKYKALLFKTHTKKWMFKKGKYEL